MKLEGWVMVGFCHALSLSFNLPPKWVGAMFGYEVV